MRRSASNWIVVAAVLVSLAEPGRFHASAPGPYSTRVLLVMSSSAAAYGEAAEGARETLLSASATVATANLDSPGGDAAIRQNLGAQPDVVLAIGSAAVDFIAASKSSVPTFATMILDSDPFSSQGRAAAAVTLDLPPSAMLGSLRQLFPTRKRIAIIRGPALTAAAAADIQTQARRTGYEAQIVDCPSPKQLIEGLGSLRGKVDFVWCLPDRSLYPAPAVSALTLAAIRNGLAVIGFSEGLVRAGALAGFYPDYRDIGAQSAEAALKLVADGQPRRERPRKFRTAVNDRVARVLGMEPHRTGGLELVTVR